MAKTRATAESYAALKYCQDVKKQARLARVLNSTIEFHAARGETTKMNKIMLKKAMIDQDVAAAEELFDQIAGVSSEALKYLYIDGKTLNETGRLIGYSPDHISDITREARKKLYPLLPEVYKKSAQ